MTQFPVAFTQVLQGLVRPRRDFLYPVPEQSEQFDNPWKPIPEVEIIGVVTMVDPSGIWLLFM